MSDWSFYRRRGGGGGRRLVELRDSCLEGMGRAHDSSSQLRVRLGVVNLGKAGTEPTNALGMAHEMGLQHHRRHTRGSVRKAAEGLN